MRSKSASLPVGHHHHARQCAGFFIDIRFLGVGERNVRSPAASETIDLLDRNAGRDDAHPEQVRERRAIRRIERREPALNGQPRPYRRRASPDRTSVSRSGLWAEDVIKVVASDRFCQWYAIPIISTRFAPVGTGRIREPAA